MVSDETDVLLVGAEPRDARVVSCGLSREGVSCELAVDLRSVIDRLTAASDDETGETLPSLIAIDLSTAPDDGLTVLKAVRSSPLLRPLPTVALVNETVPPDEAAARVRGAYDHGVNGHVSEPPDVEAYAAAIREMAAFWFSCVSLPPESLYTDTASIQYD